MLNRRLRRVFSARGSFRKDQGAALVETAIATSVVLMLLLGVFDFSLYFYTYHYVSDAAREGSRYAMVRGSDACGDEPNLDVCNHSSTGTGATAGNISSYVTGLSYPGINPSNMTVSTSWLCAGSLSGSTGQTWSACGTGATQNAPGNQVQVKVTYNFPLSIPFLWQKTWQVTSTSSMVIAQ